MYQDKGKAQSDQAAPTRPVPYTSARPPFKPLPPPGGPDGGLPCVNNAGRASTGRVPAPG